MKQTFTPDEMYARAQATLEPCLLHGVTHMRTQVEVDPNVGLLGFEVIEHLHRDYAWAIDLQPCVFLQEGWTDVPGADENLVACLERGAPVVGGGIRYDTDGPGQIQRVFALAQHYDVDAISISTAATTCSIWITRSCARARSSWGGRAGSLLGMGPNFPVCRSPSKPPSGSGSARLGCPWRCYPPPTSSMVCSR
jgi:cytosine deaminase